MKVNTKKFSTLDFNLELDKGEVILTYSQFMSKEDKKFIKLFVKEALSKLDKKLEEKEMKYNLKLIILAYTTRNNKYDSLYRGVVSRISKTKVKNSLKGELNGDFSSVVARELKIPQHLAEAKCNSMRYELA